jgi:hypothetical protein
VSPRTAKKQRQQRLKRLNRTPTTK